MTRWAPYELHHMARDLMRAAPLRQVDRVLLHEWWSEFWGDQEIDVVNDIVFMALVRLEDRP